MKIVALFALFACIAFAAANDGVQVMHLEVTPQDVVPSMTSMMSPSSLIGNFDPLAMVRSILGAMKSANQPSMPMQQQHEQHQPEQHEQQHQPEQHEQHQPEQHEQQHQPEQHEAQDTVELHVQLPEPMIEIESQEQDGLPMMVMAPEDETASEPEMGFAAPPSAAMPLFNLLPRIAAMLGAAPRTESPMMQVVEMQPSQELMRQVNAHDCMFGFHPARGFHVLPVTPLQRVLRDVRNSILSRMLQQGPVIQVEPVATEPESEPEEEEENVCSRDVRTLCGDIPAEKAFINVAACINKHQDRVSKPCLDLVRDSIAFNCAPDVVSLCGHVSAKQDIIKCINANAQKLSPKCTKAIKQHWPSHETQGHVNAQMPKRGDAAAESKQNVAAATTLANPLHPTTKKVLMFASIAAGVVLLLVVATFVVRQRRKRMSTPHLEIHAPVFNGAYAHISDTN